MKPLRLDKSFLYEKRYIFGFSALIILFSLILLFVSLNLPGGLSEQEIESVVISDSLRVSDISTFAVPNLPYHLAQRISITALGVSTFSIKLPSLIAALGTLIGLILLLSSWFHRNMAILATTIIMSTGQFLLVAQTGAPDIMYLFWSTWILTLSVFIARTPKGKSTLLYKSLLMLVLTLSLYAPLSIYIVIALGLAVITHPHLRHIVKRLHKTSTAVASVFGAILLLPLITSIIYKPSLILTLLGMPPQAPNILENLKFLFRHYFDFVSANDISVAFITFNITAMVMIIIGIVQLTKTRQTARSYIITAWGLLLLVPIIIYPLNTNVLFIPLSLLLTMGLSSVLLYWYKLFPLNPYARVAGLIPIVILVSSVVLAGLENYIYGYRYNPTITSYFSKDIRLLPSRDQMILLTSEKEWPFYNVVARHTKNLTATTEVPDTDFVATKDGRPATPSGYVISEVITDTTYRNADRFYIITKQNN